MQRAAVRRRPTAGSLLSQPLASEPGRRPPGARDAPTSAWRLTRTSPGAGHRLAVARSGGRLCSAWRGGSSHRTAYLDPSLRRSDVERPSSSSLLRCMERSSVLVAPARGPGCPIRAASRANPRFEISAGSTPIQQSCSVGPGTGQRCRCCVVAAAARRDPGVAAWPLRVPRRCVGAGHHTPPRTQVLARVECVTGVGQLAR
jgi:hypothetical protein